MIRYIKGDLFKEEHPFIAHGVNCQGKMNSGVAKIIRNKFPEAYEDYKHFCSLRDPDYLLGSVRKSSTQKGTIVHCFTQLKYGYNEDVRYVSYDAIDDCMNNIGNDYLYKYDGYYIAMPKIGSGLGGGEWSIIESIISHRLKELDVRIYEL